MKQSVAGRQQQHPLTAALPLPSHACPHHTTLCHAPRPDDMLTVRKFIPHLRPRAPSPTQPDCAQTVAVAIITSTPNSPMEPRELPRMPLLQLRDSSNRRQARPMHLPSTQTTPSRSLLHLQHHPPPTTSPLERRCPSNPLRAYRPPPSTCPARPSPSSPTRPS